MNDNYFSFLICSHPDKVDVYVNGLPLGVIKSGAFIPHEFLHVDRTKHVIKFEDIRPPVYFKNAEELKQYLHSVVNLIHIENRPQ